ncbi:hypothetical protein CC80DRAFT_124733 [Byssothecium circinans]|uniref:Uncharacterized protein n=1 Tax=Byssothecium circinans TaxID=147558 RepID=A0A6A5TNQ4_9PLEO|nr:hypothetical protein CC80DRAFT_124733 [Byssothecium circinans]
MHHTISVFCRARSRKKYSKSSVSRRLAESDAIYVTSLFSFLSTHPAHFIPAGRITISLMCALSAQTKLMRQLRISGLSPKSEARHGSRWARQTAKTSQPPCTNQLLSEASQTEQQNSHHCTPVIATPLCAPQSLCEAPSSLSFEGADLWPGGIGIGPEAVRSRPTSVRDGGCDSSDPPRPSGMPSVS